MFWRKRVPVPQIEDLSWIDGFVERIRPHVTVREADSLLILMPNQVHRLNRTGLLLLKAVLGGASIETVLAQAGSTPDCHRQCHRQCRRQVADFFFALHKAMRGCLGEGSHLRGVDIVPFEGGFHRLPVLSEIALTSRCNLTCSFCYAACSPGRSHDSMSTEDVKRVIRIIRQDAQVPSTSFTGGEPTLREDLAELIGYARSVGMRVNLITNGTLATAQRVRRWVDAGLNSVQVSLEGGSPAIHDALTGVPGSFERTVAGIRAFQASGIHVHTNTTINRRNRDHLEELVDRVASMGLNKLSMNLVLPCGTAQESPGDLLVRYDEVAPILARVRSRARRNGVELMWYSPVPVRLFNSVAEGLGSKGCAASDGLLSVSPTGDVLPCSSFPYGVGNLLSEPFEKIWQSRAALRLRAKALAPAACHGCGLFKMCEGACPLYWAVVGTAEAEKCRGIHAAAS
ncbi:MAG: radical SAM protein [Acidobacteria bacterium]|nr:radical SAM protein [Acidobacteriota bacterium]